MSKNNPTNSTSEGASKKLVPELRFPEFVNEGEWEYIPLCQVSHRITGKCKGDEGLCVLTNSATGGIVRQQDYFEREIVTKSNLGNYQILDVDDFVYNPRISTAAPVGPISRNKLVKGIMSPLYTIFRFRSGNKDFLEQYFGTTSWHKYIKAKANFGARHDRINITTDDFFKLPIPQPESREQQKIAQCLSSLDELIAATKEKVKLLKEHKRGLMQKLFPAKGKTLPELRFPEFNDDGEWKYVPMCRISRKITDKYKSDKTLPVLTNSASSGVVKQQDYFDREIVTKSNLDS